MKLAVGGRLGRDLNVRPAIALPAFAVISQIGLVWLLLSAPILVIARNTVRYLRGRMSEPPQPAGVLPWRAPARGRRRAGQPPPRRARPPPRSVRLPGPRRAAPAAAPRDRARRPPPSAPRPQPIPRR